MKKDNLFIVLGTYIFIEASQRSPGDRARLVSDWLAPNKAACLQFWYHMYGRHIGELNIIIKTNKSEKLVWRQGRKDHGDKWIFAQTPIQYDSPYKVSITQTVGFMQNFAIFGLEQEQCKRMRGSFQSIN